jgi:tetratricopeptide (TPR) repeat protein
MSDNGDREFQRVRGDRVRVTVYQAAVVICGLALAIGLTKWLESKRPPVNTKQEEEKLYVTGKTLKRASVGMGAVVADWYWMRSLQYVGGKIINGSDTDESKVPIDDLKKLNLTLLYPLLDTTTTLDPKFIAAYEYGGVVLSAVDPKLAIALLQKGIEQNPDNWRLYQHLGYIYWKQNDFMTSSRYYHEGAQKPGAPVWMEAMAARVLSNNYRDTAREMYQRMKESSNDDKVILMANQRLMQIDSFDERDAIDPALAQYQARHEGRCPATWRDALRELAAARVAGRPLRVDQNDAPVDPSGVPYVLDQKTCKSDIDFKNSKVPYR